MKNAREYERKVRKLLSGMRGSRVPAASEDSDQATLLVDSILQADATRHQADRARAALEKEFVDYNEVRVAQAKEIVEAMGRKLPGAREKAEALIRALSGMFDRGGNISLEYMGKLPKRELRRHLSELGLSPYAAARVAMLAFNTHAMPVDRSLVECLEMDGLAHPGSSIEDVQGFLERIVQQKDAPAAHAFLRRYVEKHAKLLARKHKAEAHAHAKEARARGKSSEEDLDDLDRMEDADLPAERAPVKPAAEEGKARKDQPRAAAPKPKPAPRNRERPKR